MKQAKEEIDERFDSKNFEGLYSWLKVDSNY
jgi:hypothetical protein